MDKINAEERAKTEAVIQDNIRLQQAIKDNELSHKIYKEQHDLSETEKLNNVQLQTDLYKAKQLNNIDDDTNIDEELHNTITANAQTKKQIEQLNMLEKSRNDHMQSYFKSQEAAASADYYLTNNSIEMQNKIIDTERQTLYMLKQSEALNDLVKANTELQKSNLAQSKAQYLLDNNDANVVSQVAYLQDELSKAQNDLSQLSTDIQSVKDSINERYEMVPDDIIQQFYQNNPKYYVASQSLNNLSLGYLQELDRDLAAYIDKNETSI
ncbi:hypothetical protein GPJ56_010287 [Histomonas meleagridis]|uniref:uncharacterized protein n=1 Tax=Histomonas meleagridis TaxID=135588 RepID=UPI00355A1F23|nr:hypothetical protein GPJ56_010287 [Histomonas meleagridis]KAH0797156.1 hypothetical protein GO595_011049 [Histomonas meleagridis]